MPNIAAMAGFLFLAALAVFMLPQFVDILSTSPVAGTQQDAFNLFPIIIILLGAMATVGVVLALGSRWGR